MRAQLEAVAGELRRLRSEGVARVWVADETMTRLRELAEQQHGDAVEVIDEPPPPTKAPRASKPAAASDAPGLRWDGQPIAPLPTPPEIHLPQGSRAEQMDWLRERVLSCPVCNEHVRPDRKLVFGVGTPDAQIFFCGEGPGADEERQGEPLGRAACRERV